MNTKPLRRHEAAEYLRDKGYPIAPATLAKYATLGCGPAYCTFGRITLYEVSDLDAWVAARTRKNSAEGQ